MPVGALKTTQRRSPGQYGKNVLLIVNLIVLVYRWHLMLQTRKPLEYTTTHMIGSTTREQPASSLLLRQYQARTEKYQPVRITSPINLTPTKNIG